MARNNRLRQLRKAFEDELLAEGFTRHEPVKGGYISLRSSQTSLHRKVVILTAQELMSDGRAIVSVTINGTAHYGPRHGLFSDIWRPLVNVSLLMDDILDWSTDRLPALKPEGA